MNTLTDRLGFQQAASVALDEEYAGTHAAMMVAANRALECGLEVVFGTPTTLLLDFDDGAIINKDMYRKVVEQFGAPEQTAWRSRNGGLHVVLTFPQAAFEPAQALALETALGSDPLRTILGVKRMLTGVTQPRMLFKPQQARR